MITETSQLAYKNDALPTLGSRQLAVLEALQTMGEGTNLEVATRMGAMINTITPRMNELVKMGKVEQIGKRKCSISGRLAYVWGLKKQPTLL